MIIGIDCRMLGSGFGLGRYVQQLVLHLEHIDQNNQYVLFFRKENWDAYQPTHGNIRKVMTDIPWYGWKEQVLLKKCIQKEQVDSMHFPHWNVPLLYRDPFVVTIHDLTMFHYPRPEATTRGRFLFWIKDAVHRLVVRHAVRRAQHIITTSDFTKHDLHRTLHVPLKKMTTIYQAPFGDGSNHAALDPKSILEKYGITQPYVLYVGSAYPHKNLARLLKAWRLFQDDSEEEYQLVLVGKEDYFYKKLKEDSRPPASAVWTGFVSDDALSVLYKNAALFVFPSLYEGFGLPPLEAMARGVPVVASSASCTPEVLGEAALYVDPENIHQMADMLTRGLTDEDIRLSLRIAARETLRRYSWERLARETLLIYEDDVSDSVC